MLSPFSMIICCGFSKSILTTYKFSILTDKSHFSGVSPFSFSRHCSHWKPSGKRLAHSGRPVRESCHHLSNGSCTVPPVDCLPPLCLHFSVACLLSYDFCPSISSACTVSRNLNHQCTLSTSGTTALS